MNTVRLVYSGKLLIALGLTGAVALIAGCSKKSTKPENRAPVIASVTANPQTVNASGTSTIAVVASDPDGDQLQYTYTAAFGTVQPNGPMAIWTLPAQPGAYTINVTASDGHLSSNAGQAGVTVSQPQVVTRVSGTISFVPGQSGDLSNCRVAIYTTLDEWANDTPVRFVATTGSGAQVTYIIDNVVPGNYYIDAWKDVNNNGVIDFDSGDFYGWYGNGAYPNGTLTQFPVNQGQTASINIQMAVL